MPYPSRIDADSLGRNTLKIVETLGWDAWSLRDVARALGVSVNALYRYVDSREDLVVAAGEAAALELQAHLAEAAGEGEARLVELAHRYVLFAVARPHAFSAFVHAKPFEDDPRIAAWRSVLREVRNEVVALLPDASSAAALAYWALIRGRAELARRPTSFAAPTAGLSHAVKALILGFRQMGKVPSPFQEDVKK